MDVILAGYFSSVCLESGVWYEHFSVGNNTKMVNRCLYIVLTVPAQCLLICATQRKSSTKWDSFLTSVMEERGWLQKLFWKANAQLLGIANVNHCITTVRISTTQKSPKAVTAKCIIQSGSVFVFTDTKINTHFSSSLLLEMSCFLKETWLTALDVNFKHYTIMMWWLEFFPPFLSINVGSQICNYRHLSSCFHT